MQNFINRFNSLSFFFEIAAIKEEPVDCWNVNNNASYLKGKKNQIETVEDTFHRSNWIVLYWKFLFKNLIFFVGGV